MSKMFRLLILVLLAGGWTLAASAIHVLRTPGESGVPYLPGSWGRVTLITKDHLGFKDTYADAPVDHGRCRGSSGADGAAECFGQGWASQACHRSGTAPVRPERNDRDGEPGPIVSR